MKTEDPFSVVFQRRYPTWYKEAGSRKKIVSQGAAIWHKKKSLYDLDL